MLNFNDVNFCFDDAIFDTDNLKKNIESIQSAHKNDKCPKKISD